MNDFEKFAQRMADALYVKDADGTRPRTDIETVLATRDWYVEQLRQAWNARRAADLAALAPVIEKLGDAMDPDNARSFVADALCGSDG